MCIRDRPGGERRDDPRDRPRPRNRRAHPTSRGTCPCGRRCGPRGARPIGAPHAADTGRGRAAAASSRRAHRGDPRGVGSGPGALIYLDTSVALAPLLGEDRAPTCDFWDESARARPCTGACSSPGAHPGLASPGFHGTSPGQRPDGAASGVAPQPDEACLQPRSPTRLGGVLRTPGLGGTSRHLGQQLAPWTDGRAARQAGGCGTGSLHSRAATAPEGAGLASRRARGLEEQT